MTSELFILPFMGPQFEIDSFYSNYQAGILVGYYNSSLSEDGVTLSHPVQSYTGLYNFYDPGTH